MSSVPMEVARKPYVEKPSGVPGESWLSTWKGWGGVLTWLQNLQVVRTLRASRMGMVVKEACGVSEARMHNGEGAHLLGRQ